MHTPRSGYRRLLLVTAATGQLFAAATAVAQSPPQPQPQLEEIVVTGSRIRQPNLVSTSPVTVVGAEEVAFQGTTRVEDLVNNLPQAFADQGGNVSNGASGTATVNLRNLGNTRTLVLLDGRRLPAGSPAGPVAPDLNQIPASLVERVEIVTGGASAVYGSDAVAGVVNFIMKADFEGVLLDTQYSFFQHKNRSKIADIVRARGFPLPDGSVTDGFTRDVTAAMGVNSADGRGNITLYAGYRKIDAVAQSERDYSSCSLGGATDFTCLGSGTTAPAQFGQVRQNGTDGARFTLDPAAPNGNAFRPYVAARDSYNFGPLNFYQRPDERYILGAFGRFEMRPGIEAYAQVTMHDDRTLGQLAPSGMFAQRWLVPCDNPLMSAQQRDLLCTQVGLGAGDMATAFIARRNVEGGPRQSDLRHTSFRVVGGLRGEIADGWSYDLSGQHGEVAFSNVFYNEFSITRAQRALDVVTDPATGRPVCRSVLNGIDPACVPYNLFSIGGVTPEALAYLQVPGVMKGTTKQDVFTASVSGDLGQYGLVSPWATSGLAMALGAEHRKEGLELTPAEAFTSGDLAGQGGPTIGVEGSFEVKELFGELRVPLVEGQPLVHQLTLDLGYRYSDYTTVGGTNTFKVGGDWAPVDDLRFRAGFNRAVRAPNVVELFAAQGVALFNMDNGDPCAGQTPRYTLEQCARTGVTAAQYGTITDNTAGQFNQLLGGNQDLAAEKSDTISLGFVATPTLVPGLSVTVDWFQIKVKDQIGTIPPDLAIARCAETGDEFYCSLIRRGAGGTLWFDPAAYVIATNVNTAKVKTSGLDVELLYSLDLMDLTGGDHGSLGFSLIGTYLDSFVSEPLPGEGTYDCKGLYGNTCGIPLPEWRHKLRVTWTTPWDVQLSTSWRYIDSVKIDTTSSNPLLSGTVNRTAAKLGSQSYIDLAGNVTVTENITLTGGINNVMDKAPPLTTVAGAPFGNGNTYPQVYDALGRYIFVGASFKF